MGSFGVDYVTESWRWGRRCGATSLLDVGGITVHHITRDITARNATKSSGCEKKMMLASQEIADERLANIRKLEYRAWRGTHECARVGLDTRLKEDDIVTILPLMEER